MDDLFVEFSAEVQKLQDQLNEGCITYEEFFNAVALKVVILSQLPEYADLCSQAYSVPFRR